jgi:CubicO group peptidase (beta-lactamase class C family)
VGGKKLKSGQILKKSVATLLFALAFSFPAAAENWNKALESNGRILEKSSPTLEEMRTSFTKYYLGDADRQSRQTVAPSKNTEKFFQRLRSDKHVEYALSNSGLISYILFEDNIITVDAMSPKRRLGDLFDVETKLNSQSVGKSIVSYLLGHAICEGYIDGIKANMNDWPLITGTLYEDQPILDLINMNAGDSKYFKRRHARINGKTVKFFDSSASSTLKKLRGTSANKNFGNNFYYNNFLTIVINNYIAFKLGDSYNAFMERVFQDHVGINNEVFFVKVYDVPNPTGYLRYTFFATRYDYLRIAKAILEDWRNDTCVGKYLKEIYKNKISKPSSNKSPYQSSRNYAGFFHTDFIGVAGTIFGMNGYGGQNIFINFDTGKIIVAHAVHQDYNWRRIILDAIGEPVKGNQSDDTANIGPATVVEEKKTSPILDRTTKYDRTVSGMKVRFECLADYAAANDISDLPTEQEIESLTTNLEGNDYYRSKRQIVKAGISKEAMDANKAALVRLVNFEGTNDEYCAKPLP